MKSFVASLLITGVVCFGLGYTVAQFSTDEIVVNTPTAQSPQVNSNHISENDFHQILKKEDLEQPSLEITQTRANQVANLIAEASPEKVEHYLNQVFPNTDFSQIKDKKKFAQRIAEEFTQTKNDEQNDLKGQVTVAIEEQPIKNGQALQNIYKSQYLFAHLDTFNKVENAPQVFIRWIYRDTGEVLFFAPQKITANKSQNWVSFTPEHGWKAGTYDVRYYQMKDDLQPIAQTSYVIQSISE